jgi:hypothetical protein
MSIDVEETGTGTGTFIVSRARAFLSGLHFHLWNRPEEVRN